MKGSRNEMGNEGIITSDEIKIILDRYRIGKKPLAKLLGWGETTIIRYMEGDIPTNEYSNKLKVLLNDPEFYYDLLMKRKDFLTGVAYRKSRRAVLTMIMASKLYAAAYYFVNISNTEISPGYIQFLLYYSQAFSLALYDKELFQDECLINTEYRPYPMVYENMKRCAMNTIDLPDGYLSQDETEMMDAVYECFSWYGPKALQALTAYEKLAMMIARDKYNNKIISKNSIKEYFKEIIEQYNITGLKDIGNYPEKRLMEIKGT